MCVCVCGREREREREKERERGRVRQIERVRKKERRSDGESKKERNHLRICSTDLISPCIVTPLEWLLFVLPAFMDLLCVKDLILRSFPSLKLLNSLILINNFMS